MNLESKFFFQDTDLKHKSCLVMKFLAEKNLQLIDHPPQSPDLNPIEDLWELVNSNLEKTSFRNRNELKNAIFKAWNSISAEEAKKYEFSMPNTIKAVKIAKGGPQDTELPF